MSRKVEMTGGQPRARTEALVMRQTGEELLVYDLERHRAHCLNRAAALVWSECDGVRTVEEIAEGVGKEMNQAVSGEWVTFALRQLEESNLLSGQYRFRQRACGNFETGDSAEARVGNGCCTASHLFDSRSHRASGLELRQCGSSMFDINSVLFWSLCRFCLRRTLSIAGFCFGVQASACSIHVRLRAAS